MNSFSILDISLSLIILSESELGSSLLDLRQLPVSYLIEVRLVGLDSGIGSTWKV